MVSCVCYHLVRFGHDALRRRRNRTTGLAALLVACFLVAPAQAGTSLILQSTTSTDNSGLYDYLLPHYAAISGIEVKVVAVGTGQDWKMRAIATATLLSRMRASWSWISYPPAMAQSGMI